MLSTRGPGNVDNLKLKIAASTLFIFAAFFTGLSVYAAETTTAFDTSHQVFSRELAKYVTDAGVRYASWKKKTGPLTAYLDSLSALSLNDYDALPENDRKALWINASNAFTIKLVLENYPIAGKNKDYPADSFRQIPDAWERLQFKVAGHEVTLDEIEHNILRRDFHDCRAHFAVVCAAKGSPILNSHAFVGKDIDVELDQCKTRFLAETRNISFDDSTKILKVSKIFQWFALDFAPRGWCKKFQGRLPTDEEVIIEYLTDNGPPGLKTALQENGEKVLQDKSAQSPVTVEYKSFDWSLNDLL